MIACLQLNGLVFIVDNLNQIRYELIYYVLLKATINPDELLSLRKIIMNEGEHPMRGMMESGHIVEMIDKLVACN